MMAQHDKTHSTPFRAILRKSGVSIVSTLFLVITLVFLPLKFLRTSSHPNSSMNTTRDEFTKSSHHGSMALSQETRALIYLSEAPDETPTQRLNYTLFPTTNVQNNNEKNDPETLDPLSNCPITSQIRLRTLYGDNNNQGEEDSWLLETLDIDGNPKSIGGDEFYVIYHDSSIADLSVTQQMPTAVANIDDLENGSYRLSFSSLPNVSLANPLKPGKNDELSPNSITVHLVYTCGIGMIPKPLKDSWNNGGFILTTYTIYGVPIPPIREFVPPSPPQLHPIPIKNDTARRITLSADVTSESQEKLDLSSYDKVIYLGDSNMEYFCSHRKITYRRNTVKLLEHISFPINNETYRKFVNQANKLLDHMWVKIDKPDEEKSIAIVMGSGTWDLLAETVPQGRSFENHLKACRDLIVMLRDTVLKKKRFSQASEITLVWKSPVAHHVHALIGFPQLNANLELVNRLKYASSGRSHYLYTHQKALMEELGIPFLDIYEPTYLSAFYHKPKDVRHYRPQFNFMMNNWFFSEEVDVSDFNWGLQPKLMVFKKEIKKYNKKLEQLGESWSP